MGENKEKYKSFSVSINKKIKRYKKTIKYKISFSCGKRLMQSLMSCLVGNFADRLHKSNDKDCTSCVEFVRVKDKISIFKCSDCSKFYGQKFDDDLKNWFGSR